MRVLNWEEDWKEGVNKASQVEQYGRVTVHVTATEAAAHVSISSELSYVNDARCTEQIHLLTLDLNTLCRSYKSPYFIQILLAINLNATTNIYAHNLARLII